MLRRAIVRLSQCLFLCVAVSSVRAERVAVVVDSAGDGGVSDLRSALAEAGWTVETLGVGDERLSADGTNRAVASAGARAAGGVFLLAVRAAAGEDGASVRIGADTMPATTLAKTLASIGNATVVSFWDPAPPGAAADKLTRSLASLPGTTVVARSTGAAGSGASPSFFRVLAGGLKSGDGTLASLVDFLRGQGAGVAVHGTVPGELSLRGGAPNAAAGTGARPAMLTGAEGGGAAVFDGEWSVRSTDDAGSTYMGILAFKTGPGGYVAEWDTGIVGKVVEEAPAFAEGEVRLDVISEYGGIKFPLSLRARVEGDRLNGEYTLSSNGSEMKLSMEGIRKKKVKLTGDVDLPGDWVLDIVTPGGAVSRASMKIELRDGGFLADLKTEIGSGVIRGIDLRGNEISFDTVVEYQGQSVPMKFKGTVGGGAIEGVADAEYDGEGFEFPLSGVKL